MSLLVFIIASLYIISGLIKWSQRRKIDAVSKILGQAEKQGNTPKQAKKQRNSPGQTGVSGKVPAAIQGGRISTSGKKEGSFRHDGVCSAAKVKKSGLDALGLEDRENDWLARQLKEEARIKRRMYSDMK